MGIYSCDFCIRSQTSLRSETSQCSGESNFLKCAKSSTAMSGPQWRNVNASFNATWGNTMVVVAGRLTALSEDRNVLPTVAHRGDSGIANRQAGDGPAGVIRRLRGCFRILSFSGGPRKDTIVLASTIGWLGRITRRLFGAVPSLSEVDVPGSGRERKSGVGGC